MKFLYALLLVAILLMAVMGLISCIGSFNPPPTVDPEEQYYRGAYDLCVFTLETTSDCRFMIRQLVINDWYNQPSIEWTWPLVEESDVIGDTVWIR